MNATTHSEARAVAVSSASAGSLLMDPSSMAALDKIADLMISGRVTVPQHLKGSKGDCFAVALQSMQWGMNPFAVAQKTYISQSGALGYEAQLISAALTESGALQGDPDYEFIGDWDKILGKVEERKSEKGGKYYVATYTKQDEIGLGVICRAKLVGESKPREMKVMLTQCFPRFSTQWATDPRQQICYVAVRKWGRLHKPGVLLGVYTPDELEQAGEKFMGTADEVPPEPQQPPGFPVDRFAKNLPEWRKAIALGKATPDSVIAKARTIGALTAEQEAAIRSPLTDAEKPAPKKAPDITDVQPKNEPPAEELSPRALLEQRLNEAQSLDEVYALGEQVATLPDPADQAAMNDLFDTRVTHFGG